MIFFILQVFFGPHFLLWAARRNGFGPGRIELSHVKHRGIIFGQQCAPHGVEQSVGDEIDTHWPSLPEVTERNKNAHDTDQHASDEQKLARKPHCELVVLDQQTPGILAPILIK